VTADDGRLRRILNRLLSDDPLVRATAIQSAIFAFGTGTFITGEAVYSIKIIGLTVTAIPGHPRAPLPRPPR